MKLSYEACKPITRKPIASKPARRFRKRYAVIGFFALMAVVGNVAKEPAPATASQLSEQPTAPAKFEVNKQTAWNLAYACETEQIRPFLHDPNSFRKINHTYKETVDEVHIQVRYTATNAFGARVQGRKICTYTL